MWYIGGDVQNTFNEDCDQPLESAKLSFGELDLEARIFG
jgi:hypothetical protein